MKFSFPAIGMIALAACQPPVAANARSWVLKRTSIDRIETIHIATFDAPHGETYNQENCERAAMLFQAQPGVAVSYYCEPLIDVSR